MDPTAIAFIGLGQMGAPMAHNLLKAGFTVVGHDREVTVAEQFTGIPGVLVDIKDTIKGFNMIMDGELDHIPESAFNLKGTIEEAIEDSDDEISKVLGE